MNEAKMKAIEARRQYYKQYRAKHKEQIKVYQQRYWQKKADMLLSQSSK